MAWCNGSLGCSPLLMAIAPTESIGNHLAFPPRHVTFPARSLYPSRMNTEQLELASLRLLSEMQAELRDALNALGGKQGEELVENYLFYIAAHINRAVEGYIYLRESGRFEASGAVSGEMRSMSVKCCARPVRMRPKSGRRGPSYTSTIA